MTEEKLLCCKMGGRIRLSLVIFLCLPSICRSYKVTMNNAVTNCKDQNKTLPIIIHRSDFELIELKQNKLIDRYVWTGLRKLFSDTWFTDAGKRASGTGLGTDSSAVLPCIAVDNTGIVPTGCFTRYLGALCLLRDCTKCDPWRCIGLVDGCLLALCGLKHWHHARSECDKLGGSLWSPSLQNVSRVADVVSKIMMRPCGKYWTGIHRGEWMYQIKDLGILPDQAVWADRPYNTNIDMTCAVADMVKKILLPAECSATHICLCLSKRKIRGEIIHIPLESQETITSTSKRISSRNCRGRPALIRRGSHTFHEASSICKEVGMRLPGSTLTDALTVRINTSYWTNLRFNLTSSALNFPTNDLQKILKTGECVATTVRGFVKKSCFSKGLGAHCFTWGCAECDSYDCYHIRNGCVRAVCGIRNVIHATEVCRNLQGRLAVYDDKDVQGLMVSLGIGPCTEFLTGFGHGHWVSFHDIAGNSRIDPVVCETGVGIHGQLEMTTCDAGHEAVCINDTSMEGKVFDVGCDVTSDGLFTGIVPTFISTTDEKTTWLKGFYNNNISSSVRVNSSAEQPAQFVIPTEDWRKEFCIIIMFYEGMWCVIMLGLCFLSFHRGFLSQ